jgi:hypothetical protein
VHRWLLLGGSGVLALFGCGSDDAPAGQPSNGGGAATDAGSGSGGTSGTSGSNGSSGTDGIAGASGSGGSNGGSSGTGGGGDAGAKRSFRLGFTPFPYDSSEAAVDWVYDKLESDADLIAFHTTEGVPWVEAARDAAFAEYGDALKRKWTEHQAHSFSGHAVYVALTPLDDSRSRLADYWGAQDHMPLPAPWDGYAFDAPQVKSAYLSFCRRAIAFYSPDYLAIGIEVNLLSDKAEASWAAYVELHRSTYEALKRDHPTLPVFVTVTAVDLLEGWTDGDHRARMRALQDLLPYTDILGISFYPYMSAYLTNPYPAVVFEKLQALANGKPIAIAESGYPAQAFTMPSFNLSFEGTPEKQRAFVADQLSAGDRHQLPFIVNFVARDYDELWQKLPAESQELGMVWRDTGLYDEAGMARPALALWRSALARPR